jgi:phosphoserine phosphatase
MSTIFSPEHINAHQALLQFLSINPVQQYDVETHTWTDAEDIFATTLKTPVLTISAQHLNAYLVQSILAQLPTGIANQAIRLHPLSDAFSATVVQVVLNDMVDKTWLADIAAQYYVDVFCITDAPRLADPGVIVMDMDSTVIQIECIDEIAKLCGKGMKSVQ